MTGHSKRTHARAFEYGQSGWKPLAQEVTIPSYQAIFLNPHLNDLKNEDSLAFR